MSIQTDVRYFQAIIFTVNIEIILILEFQIYSTVTRKMGKIVNLTTCDIASYQRIQ